MTTGFFTSYSISELSLKSELFSTSINYKDLILKFYNGFNSLIKTISQLNFLKVILKIKLKLNFI